MSGETLCVMPFALSVELPALWDKAVEALRDKAVEVLKEKTCQCEAVSLLMDGRILPDEGLLEDICTSDCSEEAPLVIDVVQRLGLRLQLGRLSSSPEAFHNRAFVSQEDFSKLVSQCHSPPWNSPYVQVSHKILSVEAQAHCPVGEIRLSQPLRSFCELEVGEKLLVSQFEPSNVSELCHCSMEVSAAGGLFVAPALRERIRVPREALRTALKQCEGQILSVNQPLLLQHEINGPFLKLVFVHGNDHSPDPSQSGSSQGLLRHDTQVHFLEGSDASVRLV